jgi:hypothetical protein
VRCGPCTVPNRQAVSTGRSGTFLRRWWRVAGGSSKPQHRKGLRRVVSARACAADGAVCRRASRRTPRGLDAPIRTLPARAGSMVRAHERGPSAGESGPSTLGREPVSPLPPLAWEALMLPPPAWGGLIDALRTTPRTRS